MAALKAQYDRQRLVEKAVTQSPKLVRSCLDLVIELGVRGKAGGISALAQLAGKLSWLRSGLRPLRVH